MILKSNYLNTDMMEFLEMKILGTKLKEIRKANGLSQAELAAGICTQATISLIEKKGQVPSTKILLSICQRLGVPMTMVIANETDEVHELLDKVQGLLFDGDFKQGEIVIQAISIHELVSADDYKRYYYYQGQLKLLADQKPDDALFFFNRAFNQYIISPTDVYGVLCTIGISRSYLLKNAPDRARLYVQQAVESLTGIELTVAVDLQLELTIYGSLAAIYHELHEEKTAAKYAHQAIDRAVGQKSLYLLDYLYLILGQAERVDNQQQALADLATAQTLATVRQHTGILEQVKNQLHSSIG